MWKKFTCWALCKLKKVTHYLPLIDSCYAKGLLFVLVVLESWIRSRAASRHSVPHKFLQWMKRLHESTSDHCALKQTCRQRHYLSAKSVKNLRRNKPFQESYEDPLDLIGCVVPCSTKNLDRSAGAVIGPAVSIPTVEYKTCRRPWRSNQDEHEHRT